MKIHIVLDENGVATIRSDVESIAAKYRPQFLRAIARDVAGLNTTARAFSRLERQRGRQRDQVVSE